MFGTKKVRNQEPSAYATKSDFCRIFNSDIRGLYLLSLLLTGNRTIAEQCFVGGLHSAQNGSQVFKEWAEAWARRMIIQNAIRMIRPWKTANATHTAATPGLGDAIAERSEFARVIDLPAFERFAFVMSVLERYSDRECSLLLGCTRGNVAAARTRALEQLGKSADLHRQLVSIASHRETRREHSGLEPQLTAVPSFAASV